MKTIKAFSILTLIFLMLPGKFAYAVVHHGKIYIQVESRGEAWYVYPQDGKRHYLGRPDDAFGVMRKLSLGISNSDFDKAKEATPARLLGRILLKVQDRGKAYYVDPRSRAFYFLGRPSDAFNVMRERGVGIANSELYRIPASASSLPAPAGQPDGRNSAGQEGYSIDAAALEKLLYDKANSKRLAGGLANLSRDSELEAIARAHSQDMSMKAYFSNTDPSGCDTVCRMDKYGYLYKKAAESIATGYAYRYQFADGTRGGQRTVGEIADSFVSNWTDNGFIMDSSCDNLGIGAVIGANGKIHVTADLSDPLITFAERYELQSFLNTILDPADVRSEKISKIHGWIAGNISYDIANYLADTVPRDSFEPYGTYANRKGVCQGYADLMHVLLKLSGIASERVAGRSDGMDGYASHAWLKLAENGEDLYIDVTWDSGYIKNREFVNSPSAAYYLIPKICIAVDHSEEGEPEKSLSEQKAYVSANLSAFNARCPLLKEKILSK